MLIDLTLSVNPKDLNIGDDMLKPFIESGHMGTHFDVMDKVFPLKSFKSNGKLIDVRKIRDREVMLTDLEGVEISEGDMVIFYTGAMEELGYATKEYAHRSAELSDEVVRFLIDRKIKLIGVDATGAMKPEKHGWVDQFCADHGVFIVENIDNLATLKDTASGSFTVFTAPLSRPDLTGLPCRVIADVE